MKNLWVWIANFFSKTHKTESLFLKDFNFQYDLKMLSLNRFDKLSTSTYPSLIKTHTDYLNDPEYLKSPFHDYMTKIEKSLPQATLNYGKLLSEIREINHSNENLVSDLGDAFYQNHPNG